MGHRSTRMQETPIVRVALMVFVAIMVPFIFTGIPLTHFWFVSFIGILGRSPTSSTPG